MNNLVSSTDDGELFILNLFNKIGLDYSIYIKSYYW